MSAPEASDQDHDPNAGGWSERNYRILKISVIVMGVLIVLGLIVVFATIVNRMVASDAPDEAAPVAVALPADVATILGPDGDVVSTALDGSRLAIVFKRPEGHAVLVVDLRSGQVLNVISGEAAR
ncbi:DUF6476 family protein [Microbaculum marinum]|uniref:DUF6476 family protein n=1 Tax=Microbaculum marinum TaxID=1764581 RepID=A0AAW9RKG1_9HYPH